MRTIPYTVVLQFADGHHEKVFTRASNPIHAAKGQRDMEAIAKRQHDDDVKSGRNRTPYMAREIVDVYPTDFRGKDK